MNTNKENISMFSQQTLTSLEMAEIMGGNDDTNILCSTNKTGKCSFNIICSNKGNCEPCDASCQIYDKECPNQTVDCLPDEKCTTMLI